MITKETVTELVEQQIRETGIFLVEVTVKAGNVIRVHVDRPEGISIDECAGISRFLNNQLDRDTEDYSLEVSSPGLGAPFKVKQQYQKNSGRIIEVLLNDGHLLEGALQTVSDDGIVLKVKGAEKEISFGEIKSSKATISFN
jgi:ribosome maturation factor RimP